MQDVFKAIADPTRREILLMLAKEEKSVNSIAEHFNMSRPAVSKHIKILREANLLNMNADPIDARQRNCQIQLEALNDVTEYLDKVETF
ncbi:MAG: metalloregulator ArsR/SmtB family transcription factor, partial [Bacteroidota bacterium]